MKIAKYFIAAAVGLAAGAAGLDNAKAVTPPKPGTDQYNLLERHIDFIKKVTGCCNWGEGRGDFEEKVEVAYREDGTPYNKYTIILDPSAYGMAGEDLEIEIPDNVVLTQDRIEKAMEACEKTNSETCTRPAFNVAWMVKAGAGYMGDRNAKGNTGKGWTIYCYLPRAQASGLAPAAGVDFAGLEPAASPVLGY